jgi:predicted ferric reductase
LPTPAVLAELILSIKSLLNNFYRPFLIYLIMGIKPRFGWPVTILITLSPIFLWASSLPLNFRYADTYSVLTSLGQLTGLIGLSMFSLNMFLSGRFKFTEDFFGGMNKVYIAHHVMGGVSFIFLLIHPLLLAAATFSVAPQNALALLLPGSDWTTNLGISALLFMMVLLILTFFINLPYEFWRLTHKFLGVVLIMGALHGIFASSDLSRDILLRNYMLFIVSLGFVPYLYRTVFFRFFIKRTDYLISELDYIAPNVIEIIMTPVRENLSYLPGQFIFVDFEKSNLPSETHPFSLTSTPTDPYLSFAAKVEGDFTKKLINVDIKSLVKIEGGFGRFSYLMSPRKSQVWIGGGIGIAPFISMAKSLVQNPGYNIYLFYSVKNKEEALYLERIKNIAISGVGITFIPWFSQTQGRLTAKTIAQQIPDIFSRDIFICGPPPMMKGLIDQFVELKIKKSHLHSEEFTII